VDHAGWLSNPQPAPLPSFPDRPVKFLAFDSEESAHAALQEGAIQAFYILESDFLSSGKAQMVSQKEPSASAINQFISFLRANLLTGQDPAASQRLLEGSRLVARSVDGSLQAGQNELIQIFTPFFAGLAFIAAVFTSSGYLMHAIVEEKENRTMEVLMTTISPTQFMAGKIVGDISIGLTQLLVWAGLAAGLSLIGRNFLDSFNEINLSWRTLSFLSLALLPSFILVSALMAIAGATVADARDAQQLASLMTLPVFIPYWLIFTLMNNPNSPLAIGLSFFPLTAPVSLTFRMAATQIPAWQITTIIATQALAAIGALWLAGRAFRLGMLRYGKKLTITEILKAK
jgi:ABC-2 type transport system permease protein